MIAVQSSSRSTVQIDPMAALSQPNGASVTASAGDVQSRILAAADALSLLFAVQCNQSNGQSIDAQDSMQDKAKQIQDCIKAAREAAERAREAAEDKGFWDDVCSVLEDIASVATVIAGAASVVATGARRRSQSSRSRARCSLPTPMRSPRSPGPGETLPPR